MKRNDGVLILECLGSSDPGSEGRFLSHMLNIMEVENQYVNVRTKNQMIALLKLSPYKYIHITTHGVVSEMEKFLGFWTNEGIISEKLLDKFNHELDGCTIISTACLSANPEYRDMFIASTLCDYYIAPVGKPSYPDSIFFSHVFYHKLFIIRKKVEDILSSYNKHYKNPHKFCLFSFSDFVNKSFL